MSFNHVIKLLINLFVFLLSAWGEGECRFELRALAAFVLLLAQHLAGCTTRKDGRRETRMKGRGERRVATTNDEKTRKLSDRKHGAGGGRGEKKARGSSRGTYTQSLSADHQINVLVYFPVLVLGLGAVADRVICVGVWAVTAV